MVMKICGRLSPFISIEIAFFNPSAFSTLFPVSSASLISVADAAEQGRGTPRANSVSSGQGTDD
jgi:hypothetical protein